jgi:anaerobic dimethyl sulfoxide reductase subunit A
VSATSAHGGGHTLPVSCNRDCGGGCPLLAHVEGGWVTRITHNPAGGPYLKGCIRGYLAAEQLYDPARLTRPLVRTGPRGSGQFREAEWPEAVRLVADGLARVRERFGDGAVYAMGGSGSCRGALHNTGRLTARFLNLSGGHVGECDSYSSAAARFTERVVLGTDDTGIDASTARHAGMIVLWGANLDDCIMGCEWRARVREAKRRGVPVVVVDPRRTESVRKLGTEWLPVWPGTDSALLLALLHVLLTDGLVDEAFVATRATGFEALRARVLGDGDGPPGLPGGGPATPEWAESVCGTPAARIVALAREWARRGPVMLVPGLSAQRTWGGEEPVRLMVALQLATGDFGRLGGSTGARVWDALPEPRMGKLPVPPAPASKEIHANDWAHALLEGPAAGYPRIGAVYVCGGNYVVQGADVGLNLRAMQAPEFSVCHELRLTETAKQCDVVLPATHWLERDDIVFPWADFLLYSHKVADPPGQARHDYDIFADVAGRLGFGEEFTEGKDEAAWLDEFLAASEVRDVEEFRRTGIFVDPQAGRVGLAEFAADPGGHPLSTPSGLVEVAGAACVAAGLSEAPEARLLPADQARPLRLVTPKSRLRVHSQLADLPAFRFRDDRSLWVNSADAATRGLRDGAAVLVESAQGRVRCACRVTDDVMPGVVSLLAGVSPVFGADGVDDAGSANVLTSSEPTLPSRGCRLHSTWVEVRATE